MLEVSFLLAVYLLLLNLFLPLIAWILFLWLFFWNKFNWFLLYLFSWFSWIGVIFFSIFDMQFIHYWVWKIEYFTIIIILLILFLVRLKVKKESLREYIKSFKINFSFDFIFTNFKKLQKVEKIYFSISAIFIVLFMTLSFSHNLTFPTYFDDSFWNWNMPAMNMFYDWWFKIFWDKTEILWRWRLGYPIFVPIYKTVITDFVWYWNDIYANIFQNFIFIFLILFTVTISYKHTKNIFYSILPATLIIGLPLVYFHTFEWYLELTSATYWVLTVYAFYKFFQNKDFDYLLLGTLFWIILASVKNDWIIVYFPWIFFAFLTIVFLKKDFIHTIKNIIKKQYIYRFMFLILFFFSPFLFIKAYYGIWFNQAAWEESAVWIEKMHFEIFPMIKHILFNQDNYNISLIFIFMIFLWFYKSKEKSYENKFILLSFIFTLIIILLVFLLTSNYRFVMDQTTVNRIFSMIFIIIFSFYSFIFFKKHD